MTRLISIFLAAFALMAEPMKYYVLVVANSELSTVRNWIDNKQNWSLPDTGLKNLAQPLYLLSDGTNQVTVRARLMCVADSQVPPSVKSQINTWIQNNPASVALFTYTNKVDTLDADLANLPTPLARKITTLIP